MITQEQKDAWVAALRSGEYEQLQGAGGFWSDGDRHCCIGVAICLQAGTPKNRAMSLGLSDKQADAIASIGSSARFQLIGMNDGRFGHKALSFAEIADVIESKPLEWLHR